MEIRQIEIGSDYFYKICDYVENNITKDNLRTNGGTLNYSNLTYESDMLLIAFDNGIPVGYNSIVKYENGYYIYQIAVKKKYQNKGIGMSMLKKVIEVAEEENTFVTAHVMDYNTSSQKIFLNSGFKKVSEDPETGNGFYVLNKQKTKRKSILKGRKKNYK